MHGFLLSSLNLSKHRGNIGGAPLDVTPTITVQPVDTFVDIADTATIFVAATGGNLLYQWKKNGVDVPGAVSNSIIFSVAGASDIALYKCVVHNGQGTVTSNEVALIVSVYPDNLGSLAVDLDPNMALAAWNDAPATGLGQDQGYVYPGYDAGSFPQIRVYPMRDGKVSEGNLLITYEDTGADLTFGLAWYWDAVPGADSYRVVGFGGTVSVDVVGEALFDQGLISFPDTPVLTPPDLIAATNGQAIASLPDQSGNVNDFTALAANNRPTLLTSAQGSHSGAVFNGTSNRLDATTQLPVTADPSTATDTPMSIIVVCKQSAQQTSMAMTARVFGLLAEVAGGAPHHLGGTTGSEQLSGLTDGTQAVTSTFCTIAIIARSKSSLDLIKNDAKVTRATGTTFLDKNWTSLGAKADDSAFLNGVVLRGLIYNKALSDLEWRSLKYYLARTYAIS